MISLITTKYCSLCRTRKSLEYYWVREDNPDQLYVFCIPCCEREHREYDWPLISTRGGGSLKAGPWQNENLILVS